MNIGVENHLLIYRKHAVIKGLIGHLKNYYYLVGKKHYKPETILADYKTLAENAFMKINEDKNDYELPVMSFPNQKIERKMIMQQ